MFTITAMPNNLLVTGKSGIGKSTVLAKVAELLEPRVISGFLSPRNHDGVTDQGWKIVGFNGVTGIVAHPDIQGHQGWDRWVSIWNYSTDASAARTGLLANQIL